MSSDFERIKKFNNERPELPIGQSDIEWLIAEVEQLTMQLNLEISSGNVHLDEIKSLQSQLAAIKQELFEYEEIDALAEEGHCGSHAQLQVKLKTLEKERDALQRSDDELVKVVKMQREDKEKLEAEKAELEKFKDKVMGKLFDSKNDNLTSNQFQQKVQLEMRIEELKAENAELKTFKKLATGTAYTNYLKQLKNLRVNLIDKLTASKKENAKLRERVEELMLVGGFKCSLCGCVFPGPHTGENCK